MKTAVFAIFIFSSLCLCYSQGLDEKTIVQTIVTDHDKAISDIEKNAESIIIPNISFDKQTLSSIVQQLKVLIRENDSKHKGVTIVVSPSAVNPNTGERETIDPDNIRISVFEKNWSLLRILKKVAELAGVKLKTTLYCFVFYPIAEPDNEIVKEYLLPPIGSDESLFSVLSTSLEIIVGSEKTMLQNQNTRTIFDEARNVLVVRTSADKHEVIEKDVRDAWSRYKSANKSK